MTIAESTPSPAPGLIRDEVYRVVVDQIVSGSLRPGDRLSERTLAAQLGVSRMPIKEAVRRLENEGFVTAVPRHGIVVATSAQDAVQDAVRVRAVLEGLAAGLLGRQVADEQPHTEQVRGELETVLAEMRQAARQRDVDQLRAVNSRFHQLIRLGCGNRYVAHLSSAVIAVDSAVRRRALADLTEMRLGVREHVDIAGRVLAGDEAGAEQRMRAHILRSGKFVLRQLLGSTT